MLALFFRAHSSRLQTNIILLTADIRAEQRRQHGVPQWSLDNKEDRVLDMSGPKKSDDASSASSTSSLLPKSRAVRRTKRS